MTPLMKTLPLVVLMAMTGSALAQTAETPDASASPPDATSSPIEGPAPDPLALSAGEEAAPEGPKVGDIYINSEYSDWDLRCIKAEGGKDPCQLYQLLEDAKNNPVAEINVFPLPDGQETAAGATIITPLETLLTQQLSLTVDGGAAKKYPFAWCSQIGCFARVGLSAADVAAFKRGSKATISIVPVAAPDQRVNIEVSLSGFTAGYDATKAKMEAQ